MEQCLLSLILNSTRSFLNGQNLNFSEITLELNRNISSHQLRTAEVRIKKLNIKEINGNTSHAFKRLSGLLSPRYNSLQTIFPETFKAKALRDVQYLDLSHNKIGSIYNNSFVNLNRLKKLDLSHNQFRTLPSQVFHGLSEMRRLNLNHNKLKAIDFCWFVELHQLKILSVTHNNISVVKFLTESRAAEHSMCTTTCSNVTNQDANNSTSAVNSNTSCFCCQHLVDNSNNASVEENEAVPVAFSSAQSLHQSSNKFVFANLGKIDLSFNNLNTVSLAFFSLFPRLQMIDLSHNKIFSLESLTSFLFCFNPTKFSKLELLLSHNRLRSIRRQDFK